MVVTFFTKGGLKRLEIRWYISSYFYLFLCMCTWPLGLGLIRFRFTRSQFDSIQYMFTLAVDEFFMFTNPPYCT